MSVRIGCENQSEEPKQGFSRWSIWDPAFRCWMVDQNGKAVGSALVGFAWIACMCCPSVSYRLGSTALLWRLTVLALYVRDRRFLSVQNQRDNNPCLVKHCAFDSLTDRGWFLTVRSRVQVVNVAESVSCLSVQYNAS